MLGIHSDYRLEPLEAESQSVTIRAIFDPVRKVDCRTLQAFQGFQHRTIIPPKQPLRHMQPVLWVDANQMCVESGVMDFGERDAVRPWPGSGGTARGWPAPPVRSLR